MISARSRFVLKFLFATKHTNRRRKFFFFQKFFQYLGEIAVKTVKCAINEIFTIESTPNNENTFIQMRQKFKKKLDLTYNLKIPSAYFYQIYFYF